MTNTSGNTTKKSVTANSEERLGKTLEKIFAPVRSTAFGSRIGTKIETAMQRKYAR